MEILLLILAFSKFIECQRKISPCPSVFIYDNALVDENIWYGTVQLQSSVTLYGITVDAIFDRRVSTFGAYHFNDAVTSNHLEFRVENKNYKLEPGKTLNINVYVQYQSDVPLLKQIRLNGQNVCVDVPIVNAVQPIFNPANPQRELSSTKKPNV